MRRRFLLNTITTMLVLMEAGSFRSSQASDEGLILHEFFVPDDAPAAPPTSLAEPIHTARGAQDPSGVDPARPGGRNAPQPGQRELLLDRDTAREGWLTYYAVFESNGRAVQARRCTRPSDSGAWSGPSWAQ